MKVKELATESQEKINNINSIIKDISQFEYDTTPKEIYLREKEAKQIIDAIVMFNKLSSSENLLFFGSRGCGKTVLLKHIKKELKSEFKPPIIYANCRYSSSAFNLLQKLMGKRMIGLSFNDAYTEFKKKYKKAILILDEFDLLSKKNDLLYFFSRVEGAKYMIILLTNDPALYDKIDESSKSSLQLQIEHFRNYNAVEIKDILLLRCKHGLKKISQEIKRICNKIGAYTIKDGYGDVRLALKTLKLYLLSNKKNKEDMIEDFFLQSKRDLYKDIIMSLNSKHKLILKSIISTQNKITKECYEKLKMVCRNNNKSGPNYNQFYSEINYLQSLGLISLIQIRGGVGRARNMIKLAFNPEILQEPIQNLVSDTF